MRLSQVELESIGIRSVHLDSARAGFRAAPGPNQKTNQDLSHPGTGIEGPIVKAMPPRNRFRKYKNKTMKENNIGLYELQEKWHGYIKTSQEPEPAAFGRATERQSREEIEKHHIKGNRADVHLMDGSHIS